MNRYDNKIAITTGDINGIGMEVVTKALNELNLPQDKVVLITNKTIFEREWKLNTDYEIIDVPFDGDMEYGYVTKEAGELSYACLKKACEIRPQAIVTAPVSKEALNLAGHKYTGQTEVLESLLSHDWQKAEMLFISKGFRVFLLTRHCALKDVPNLITKDLLIDKVCRINSFLKAKFKISKPKLALCALNPHSGEGGLLGNEEQTVMIPAVLSLKERGIDVSYPLPADTLFIEASKNYLKELNPPYDCYISMYHDQGLIPIKTVAGAHTVNMTIGLDIMRTSPCHGTAFDIAGKNIADPAPMKEAIVEALIMTE